MERVTGFKDYVICGSCKRPRLRPPAGIGGTNDCVCEVCKIGYGVSRDATGDDLAKELQLTRIAIRQMWIMLSTGVPQ